MKTMENTKQGKRLAASQVAQLKQAIEILLNVAGYVNYEDNVDALLMGIAEENKAVSRGDLGAIQQRRQEATSVSAGGGANWTAKVGEAIIGNLARGKGGRFVSASNISSMMGLLGRANISAQMIDGIQKLIANENVDSETLVQLQDAGLVNDGIVSAKANDILAAIGTGDPENLKAIVKPTKPKAAKGRGTKPEKQPKPTKDEVQRANIEKLKPQIVTNERLSEDEVNALIEFADGKDVDKLRLESLEDKGLVEIDSDGVYRFTSEGNQTVSAMQAGNLRKALDSISKAKEKYVEKQKEIAANIEKLIKSLEAEVGRDVLDEILALRENTNQAYPELEAVNAVTFDETGAPVVTQVGNQLISTFEGNQEREFRELLAKGVPLNIAQGTIAAKNFVNDFNLDCIGFKVLHGNNDDYILTWTTNSYKDREGEFFMLKALQEYVMRNETNENKGTLQFWHIPGSDFADIITQVVPTDSKFLVEIAKFRKDEIGETFKQFFLKYPKGHPEIAPSGWGTSHGFVYRNGDRDDGVYEWFDKRETTILPLDKAANSYTLMELL